MRNRTRAGKHVLIIDDEEMILDILKRRFEKMGFEVATATDGLQGLRVLDHRAFDLIVCDLQIPCSQSVTEVLQVSRHKAPDSKFVFISGELLAESDVGDMLALGADLFIKKPFSSLTEVTEEMAKLVSKN